jgi:hypothetical protein
MNATPPNFSDTSSTGILRALPQALAESSLLAAMREQFAVDVTGIRSMNRLQQLRMVDACRFLSNNLPLPLQPLEQSVAA